MKKPKNSLTSIKDILTDLFDDPDLPFNPDDRLIWQVWEEVVGPAIAKNTHPLWIKNGRLKVMASDPIWLQELELVGETIKEKLNQKLGRKAVEKIEFRMGTR